MNEARAPDFFSANAARYDRSRPALISDSTRDAMVRAARLPAGGRLLDVAAGTGRVAVPLAAAGYRVIAVDRSKDMLGVLRAKRRPGESTPRSRPGYPCHSETERSTRW